MKQIYKDTFNLICGKLIGEGIHRKVFECKLKPDLVVKVETQTNLRDFANVFEMKFWCNNSHRINVSKWLAPCEYLSPDGFILLQKKCEKLPNDFILPERLPKFLSDVKKENFGLLNGNLVCVDYAITENQTRV